MVLHCKHCLMCDSQNTTEHRTEYKPLYYSFCFVKGREREKRGENGYEDDHDDGDDDNESDVKLLWVK